MWSPGKFGVVALLMLGAIPLGLFLRSQSKLRLYLLMLLGFLPFYWDYTLNPISFELYRGDSRGLEVTLFDVLAFVLWIALPSSKDPSPYRAARWLYLFAVVLSLTQCAEILYGLFGLWKVLRMYFALAVVNRAVQDPAAIRALLNGLAAGALYQLPTVVRQRYLDHYHQTPGVFAHQNTLGLALNLMLPPCVALTLSGSKRWLPKLATLLGPIVVVFSLSRGSLGAMVLGYGLTYMFSAKRRFTGRKFAFAAVGVLAAAALAIRAGQTIINRFESAPEASAQGRWLFNRVALAMLEDNPIGIGINHFAYMVLKGRYFEMTGRDREGGIDHNIYLLTGAELGYIGLFAFLWIVIQPIVVAFRGARQARSDVRGDLMMGLGCGMLAFNLQGYLEWAWRQTPLQQIFWIILGITAGLARHIRRMPHDPAAKAFW
jgi:O-antigen ligase